MFKVTSGPVTIEEAQAFASELEKAIGEIGNGKRKSSQISLEPMIALVQFVRDFTNAPSLPNGWRLVEKPNCYVLHDGDEAIATLAGPKAAENASIISRMLDVGTDQSIKIIDRDDIRNIIDDLRRGFVSQHVILTMEEWIKSGEPITPGAAQINQTSGTWHPTIEQVKHWRSRNNLDNDISVGDATSAIDDARSMHCLPLKS